MKIEKLGQKHLSAIDAFACVETENELKQYVSKIKKRVRHHSQEMEDFLKNEAFTEQEKSLNTTHLLIDDSDNIIGYLSLCSDSIKLEPDERDEMQLTYTTIPAVKIARLAIDNRYKGHGYGKLLINYAVSCCLDMRKYAGITFITLDCYEHRKSYYEHIGFIENQVQPIQLPYDSPISMRLVINDYLEKIADEP